MMKKTKIIFTGGGSSGHVTPNLALIDKCRKQDWEIYYIGSKDSIEQRLINKYDFPFYHVPTGKLRRYFSWQNFIDPFKIIFGVIKSWLLIRRIKPELVFSKGGFVAFPVVVSAWLNNIPVVTHESDITPGLANKLSFPFAKRICVAFDETKKYIKQKANVRVTGTPVRQKFFQANKEKGLAYCGFNNAKKVILIFGGGQGAVTINNAIRAALSLLLEKYQVVHICGINKTHPNLEDRVGYRQFEYLDDELFDVMACADLVISRSGANALAELLALKKLAILIPIPRSASRGDQILNANFAAKKGLSKVIQQQDLTQETIVQAVADMFTEAADYQAQLAQFESQNSVDLIYNVLLELLPQQRLTEEKYS